MDLNSKCPHNTGEEWHLEEHESEVTQSNSVTELLIWTILRAHSSADECDPYHRAASLQGGFGEGNTVYLDLTFFHVFLGKGSESE